MVGLIVLTIALVHAESTVPVATPAQQPPAAVAQVAPERPWPPAGVSRLVPGTPPPRLIKEIKPQYSAAAREAKIQGVIGMEVVVETDGTVGEVRVTRSLDKMLGLDDEAVRTVKKWRFEPAKKDGVAVPVVVEIEMTFTLR